MKKILRHGRNSKPSSGGGGGGGDDVFTKIKDAFVKAGLADIQCYGNSTGSENYPNEPLGIDTKCNYPDFYLFNHSSGNEYQSLLVEYHFRAGYIMDSDFRKHLSVNGFLVYGDVYNSINISVGTDKDIQYVHVTMPIKITNEAGSDCYISLYYDDVEIIIIDCTLGTYTYTPD